MFLTMIRIIVLQCSHPCLSFLTEILHSLVPYHPKSESNLLNIILKNLHDLTLSVSLAPFPPCSYHILYTPTPPNCLQLARHSMLSYAPTLLNMPIPLPGTFYLYSILCISFQSWICFYCYNHYPYCKLFAWVCLSFQTMKCLSANTLSY